MVSTHRTKTQTCRHIKMLQNNAVNRVTHPEKMFFLSQFGVKKKSYIGKLGCDDTSCSQHETILSSVNILFFICLREPLFRIEWFNQGVANVLYFKPEKMEMLKYKVFSIWFGLCEITYFSCNILIITWMFGKWQYFCLSSRKWLKC